MWLKISIWIGSGALALGIVAGSQLRAAEDLPSRATRAEVAESCHRDGGTMWHDGGASRRDGRYGCVTPRGWIACDRHGNCDGGTGIAQKSAYGVGRPQKSDR